MISGMIESPISITFMSLNVNAFFLNNEKDTLRKFNAKSEEAIFLGYSTNSKAYRVFNKRTLIVEKSVHVMFDEANLTPSKKEECIDNDERTLENEIKDIRLQEKPTHE